MSSYIIVYDILLHSFYGSSIHYDGFWYICQVIIYDRRNIITKKPNNTLQPYRDNCAFDVILLQNAIIWLKYVRKVLTS